jgi:hypothetical protein
VVVTAVFVLALALAPLGGPWSWAAALALVSGAAAAASIRVLRHHGQGSRAQLARLGAAIAEANERIASENAAHASLVVELGRLRQRLAAAERVAAESRVRLQRYDLIQRPGSFEIELYCASCNAWRPSGVISSWQQFERDDPFVSGEDRFILACAHEVRADNYIARPGTKVVTSPGRAPRRWPAPEPAASTPKGSDRAASPARAVGARQVQP